MEIQNRAFVSFDGRCPFNCKHCFSYEIDQLETPRTIEQIVDSLENKEFDVIYVSQKKENFSTVENGLLLCEQLFSRYKCNLVIITRNVFAQNQINRLLQLQSKMLDEGKQLFVGISLIGIENATVSEDLSIIPTPEERIKFITTLYDLGIHAFVLIRPLFPKNIIPSQEWKKIVDLVADKISCILSGPLMVNDQILSRLGFGENDCTIMCGAESDYLDGAIAQTMKVVDVREETEELKNYCMSKGVPYFAHSLPAINYMAQTVLCNVH